jgi:uncharacterized protein (UPF0332 family)
MRFVYLALERPSARLCAAARRGVASAECEFTEREAERISVCVYYVHAYALGALLFLKPDTLIMFQI